MPDPTLKQLMIQMLDEARIEVERGNLESLVIFGRRLSESHTQWLCHAPDADMCSLYGFALVSLQRSIKTQAEDGEAPESMRGRPQ